MSIVATIEELEAIYGSPGETATVKVADRITPSYGVLIENSPFVAFAIVLAFPAFGQAKGTAQLLLSLSVLISAWIGGLGPCVTSIAGPHGAAQLYGR